ncbi:MAG: hypothetical protein J1F69_02740 [Clostridiales bacterium]|nr:hypothetical protein [Clostridiales bacterium]
MELYFEQNVTNKNVDEHKKRTKALVISKTVCLIFGIFVITTSGLLGDYFFNFFWIFLLFSVPFFVASYILGRINKRHNTEYDYVLDDELIRISEIYFRDRRKLKYTIRLRFIESVGVFDTEGYKKAERGVNKKILALVNYDDEQSVVYICYKTDKGVRQIIFLEPNRAFIMSLRRALSASALTVFDKSISDLEKRLDKKEQEEALLALESDDTDYEEDDVDDNTANNESDDADNGEQD